MSGICGITNVLVQLEEKTDNKLALAFLPEMNVVIIHEDRSRDM